MRRMTLLIAATLACTANVAHATETWSSLVSRAFLDMLSVPGDYVHLMYSEQGAYALSGTAISVVIDRQKVVILHLFPSEGNPQECQYIRYDAADMPSMYRDVGCDGDLDAYAFNGTFSEIDPHNMRENDHVAQSEYMGTMLSFFKLAHDAKMDMEDVQ